MIAFLTGVRWSLYTDWICIFFIAKDVAYFRVVVSYLYFFFWDLFNSFAHLFITLFEIFIYAGYSSLVRWVIGKEMFLIL
jgi:hypothetical protein